MFTLHNSITDALVGEYVDRHSSERHARRISAGVRHTLVIRDEHGKDVAIASKGECHDLAKLELEHTQTKVKPARRRR